VAPRQAGAAAGAAVEVDDGPVVGDQRELPAGGEVGLQQLAAARTAAAEELGARTGRRQVGGAGGVHQPGAGGAVEHGERLPDRHLPAEPARDRLVRQMVEDQTGVGRQAARAAPEPAGALLQHAAPGGPHDRPGIDRRYDGAAALGRQDCRQHPESRPGIRAEVELPARTMLAGPAPPQLPETRSERVVAVVAEDAVRVDIGKGVARLAVRPDDRQR
jgi:hypothetical protein